MMGVCRLCGAHPIELKESHILSKFIYRTVRKETASSPIIVSGGSAHQSDFQIKRYLLCEVCEGKFSEKERIAEIFGGGTRSIEALWTKETKKVGHYFSLPLDVANSLHYFATSILWRFSVIEPEASPLGNLSELVKSYLHTNNPCVSHDKIKVYVFVLKGDTAQQVATSPIFHKVSGTKVHIFRILGFEFVVQLGGVKDIFGFNPLPAAFYALEADSLLDGLLGAKINKATLRGKLKRRFENGQMGSG